MSVTFDVSNAPDLVIELESGVNEVSSEDIYSWWKEWVLLSDNAKWLPAFRVIGGDPLTATLKAGSYFFIQNQNGWRIKPPEEDIEVQITGNLYREDINLAFLIPTVDDFNTQIRLETSSLTQVPVALNPLDGIVEQQGSITLKEATSLILAAVAGQTEKVTPTNWRFKTPNGAATRLDVDYDNTDFERIDVDITPSS